MKKYCKVLFVIAVALSVVMCALICACQPQTPNGDSTSYIYDVDSGTYEIPIGSAYGEEPDYENVIIDGDLSDDLWQGKKWYTQYEPSQRIKIMVTSAMSEKGFYLAAQSDDAFIFWNGYGYFFKNTNFSFSFYDGNRTFLQLDAVSLKVTHKYVNARSKILGEYNKPGESKGLYAEIFITWDQLGIDVSKGLPESLAIFPVYNYCIALNAPSTNAIYPTFVKTTGNEKQAVLFGADGYVDGDDENAIVGSHVGGQAKTNGWKVDNAGTADETATSDIMATYNFAQTIFFRNSLNTNAKLTTKIKVKEVTADSRAGLILYRDNINYRAVALNLNPNNFVNGKIQEYNLKGYTNFPSNITITNSLSVLKPSEMSDEVELSLYNINGRLYYIINGEYAYSEEASYVAVNGFAGLYSFNASIEFSDYSISCFDSEAAISADLAHYAYTISISNEISNNLVVTTDQLAVSSTENSTLKVTMTFKPGYTLGDIYYIDSKGNKVSLKEEAGSAVGGVFALEGITDNITIYSESKKIEGDLVTLKLRMKNKQTEEDIRRINTVIFGEKPYSRFAHDFSRLSEIELSVEKDDVWSYTASANGFRTTTDKINGGNSVGSDMTDYENIYIVCSVIGGSAEAVLDENGKPVTSLSIASTVGTSWDLADEEIGKAIFQTSSSDRDTVYFSGRTISDCHVAYVEITNRTDPSAFTSFENDPAAGFVIRGSGTESFMGLRMTGLRLKPERNVWTAGSYSDVSNIANYPGYLGNVDRDNGGRFISAYAGSGTVNRIPYNGKEYTNSFLMIRKGGKLFFYACDGAAGVKSDKTNFNKLKLIQTYDNRENTGYAAVGLACTVAYNLRMDFENYWILSGKQAAEFAGDLISTPITITGGDMLTVSGDDLIGYKPASGTVSASVVNGGKVKFTASEIKDNEMFKVQFSTGTTKYLANRGDSCEYTVEKGDKVHISVTKVDSVYVSGSVEAPKGFENRAFVGTVYSSDSSSMYNFRSNSDGTFKTKVPKGVNLSMSFALDGYSMKIKEFNAVSAENLGAFEFHSVVFGGSVDALNGEKVNTVGESAIKNNTTYGDYFEYKSVSSGNGQLVIKPEYNGKENFVLTYTYERTGRPSGSTYKEDGDVGLGLRLINDGGSLDVLFIGDGYRIYFANDFNGRQEKRGLGKYNLQATTTNAPLDFKFIKMGDVVHMLAKLHSETDYTYINGFSLQDFGMSSQCTYVFNWHSYGYYDMKLYNIVLGDPTADNASEIYAKVNISQNNGGSTELVGAEKSDNVYNVVKGNKYTLNIKPQANMKLVGLKVAGKSVELGSYEGGDYEYTVSVNSDAEIEVEFDYIVYETTAKTSNAHRDARFVKAVCGNIERVFTVTLLKEEVSYNKAYLDSTARTLTLYLPTGEWTLTFYSDANLTLQIGNTVSCSVK